MKQATHWHRNQIQSLVECGLWIEVSLNLNSNTSTYYINILGSINFTLFNIQFSHLEIDYNNDLNQPR